MSWLRRFDERMRPIRRIVYVRTDRIGDVLMNLPAIRSLRLAYPKAWITLLTSPPAAELLAGHPDLDEVMVAQPRDWESWPERWALIRKIRRARFDLGVAANPSRFAHFMLWAGGVRERLGHDRKGAIFLSRRLDARQAFLGLHEIERNLKLAKLASASPWDGKIELPADDWARRRVDERLAPVLERGRLLVAVHPGTSHPLKRWSAERFGELCRRILTELDHGVVIVGGPEERPAASEIVRACPSALDWTGRTSLRELTALFMHPRVSALVSSDSGPVHVAWIAGTPAVALYAMDLAGSDPMRWGPRDGVSEAIHKPMNDIAVDEVMAALRRLLARPVQKRDEHA